MAAPGDPLLTATGLYVSREGLPILRDVSVVVHEGQAVAVLGGNGSGKTTLVRTLVGLNQYQAGSVKVFGTELSQFTQWHRIGYVPQHSSLNVQHATVKEVVSSGRLAHLKPFQPMRSADREAVRHALEQVELADRASWPFRTLSGGQKQRTLIARALATEPELLVMDEPFAGVDLHSQSGLAELLMGLREQGLGMILVLHETAMMSELVNTAITLCDGRIVPDEVPGFTQDPAPSPQASIVGLEDPLQREVS